VNKEVLEELWNGRHVDSLEVVMKETEDCEGRTAFYEVPPTLCPSIMASRIRLRR
jgi:glucose-6-phosphate 1-dehydrogenase